jgi:hypothetical protein
MLIAEKVPAGGMAEPRWLSPQQAMVRSLLIPQEALQPVPTEMKLSVGAEELKPQQTMEPSLFKPQEWTFPALTEVKVPAVGVSWMLSAFPQHTMLPFVLTPQVWCAPALI